MLYLNKPCPPGNKYMDGKGEEKGLTAYWL